MQLESYQFSAQSNVRRVFGCQKFVQNSRLSQRYCLDGVRLNWNNYCKVKELAKLFNYNFTFKSSLSLYLYINRYYKFLFPENNYQNVRFWLFVHRILMTSCFVLSIASFLIVLSALKWQWVNYVNTASFVHSVCGALTLALMLIQVNFLFLNIELTGFS